MRVRAVMVLLTVIISMLARWAVAAEKSSARAAGDPAVAGTVNDALGRPVGQVELILRTNDGKILGRAVTDKAGHFTFKQVMPGNYTVVANHGGFKTAASTVTVTTGGAASLVIPLEAETALNLAVTAQRLAAARNGLSVETGSSRYTFTQQNIQDLPQGTNTQMQSVLLQAPGVAQDSFGALHIRGEHNEIQYRVNGVQLPEGVVSGFSQTFSPRIAQSISLLEGALPAQYGYHTAGVVSIQTKTGLDLQGGNIEMYGGQRNTLNPSFEVGGTHGKLDYYATGYYLQNSRGLEPPTPGPTAHHDFTTIGNGFGYLSYILNPTTRITALGGFNLSNFQIPSNPDQTPAFKLAGFPGMPSEDIRETQLEQNYFGTVALQGLLSPEQISYQIAGFIRYSTLSFHPDQFGDLIYNGIASRAFRGDIAAGSQGDFAYMGLTSHTIRLGYYFSGERAEIDNHSLVFPAPPGNPAVQLSDNPIAIVDDTALQEWLTGVYLQDEWRPIERLTINFGLRYDWYDGVTRTDQISPRVGAVYAFPEGTTLHAAYARYFTPPPLEAVSGEDIKKFAGTTNEPTVKLDDVTQPERANYFDAGITQSLPYGIKVDLDSYYKGSQNLIDEGQFGATLVFTPFNYSTGRQYGVEFTTSMNHGNFSWYSNFAYSVAQGNDFASNQFLFTPDELPFVKRHFIFLDHDQTFTESAGVVYRLYGFMLSLNQIYASGLRSGFANTGNQPFYIQFDAGVARPFTVSGMGDFEGRFAVVNLGDWIYQIRSGSGIGVFAPQWGPRRSFYGGLKWEIPFLSSNHHVN